MGQIEPLEAGQLPEDRLLLLPLLEAGELVAAEVELAEAAQVGKEASLQLSQKVAREIWKNKKKNINYLNL